jgi:hypothetical protein
MWDAIRIQGVMYEGRLKSSWAGGSAPLFMQREAVTFMISCNGGVNIVVA